MADNYLQFSTEILGLSQEERDWLGERLADFAPPDNATAYETERLEEEFCKRNDAEDVYDWPGFGWEL